MLNATRERSVRSYIIPAALNVTHSPSEDRCVVHVETNGTNNSTCSPVTSIPNVRSFPDFSRLAPILTAPDTSKPLPPLRIEATTSGKSIIYIYPLLLVIEYGPLRAVAPATLPWKDRVCS